MANREERFGVILDVVAAVTGSDKPMVLDLCCGPGSLGARVVDRFPGATVVALDNDPVLMLLGRRAYGDLGGRLHWAEADLRSPAWTAAVGAFGPFDAVVSTTALHWLAAPTLASTYAGVARLLTPTGVLANGDHLHEPEQPRLEELQKSLRRTADDEREAWEPWWVALEAAAARDAELAAAFALRAERDADHPETSGKPAYHAHVDALRAAGFGQVGTVWQHGDDRVLVALK
jgi:trans-aconitate methyltransferase